VYRGTHGPAAVSIHLNDFQPGALSNVRTLTASTPWEGNSLQQPDAIRPTDSTAAVRDGKLELTLHPYSLVLVSVPSRPPQGN
jgi:alpha-L-arabinofuranosidase